MNLIFISFIIFILIAIAFLSKADSVLTRTSLALLGVLVTALGMMSGWGWGMMFGMPFTPLQRRSHTADDQIFCHCHIKSAAATIINNVSACLFCAELSPFILLGMGLDVMFILVKVGAQISFEMGGRDGQLAIPVISIKDYPRPCIQDFPQC